MFYLVILLICLAILAAGSIFALYRLDKHDHERRKVQLIAREVVLRKIVRDKENGNNFDPGEETVLKLLYKETFKEMLSLGV